MLSLESNFVEDGSVRALDESILLAEAATHPTNVGALCNLGTYLSCTGNLDESIALYRRALALDAQCFSTGYNLLMVLMKAGRFGDALQTAGALVVPIEFASDFDLQVGTCYLALKRYSAAVTYLARAVDARPECEVARYNLERPTAEVHMGTLGGDENT